LLPIENTTAELLAKYLSSRLRDELREKHRFLPDAIRMEVEESFGQTARYEWRK
jgi:6-pyruvoyltetrahydropterin/6-carboxytetrahydropterin synthase